MLIDCPGCGKSYQIVKAALGPAGRRVACPRCDAIWFVPLDPPRAAAAEQPLDHDEFRNAIDSRSLKWDAGRNPPAALPYGLRNPPVEISLTSADRGAHRLRPARPAASPGKPVPRRALREICTGMTLVLLMMAAIGGRREIVLLWPHAATAYAALGLPVNLRGLALENFRTVATSDGFQTVLGIEGEIANLRPAATKIPPIELSIRDRQGHVLYSWQVAAPQRSLGADQTMSFRARLAAPPGASREVLVRFVPAQRRTLLSWALASTWRKAARAF